MKASKFYGGTLFLVLAGLLLLLPSSALSGKKAPCAADSPRGHAACPVKNFVWEEKSVAKGKLYILNIPHHSRSKVSVGIAPALATVESSLWEEAGKKPVFIINGGFFDPKNTLTTSYLYKNGQLVGDPHDNRQLVENPNIQPYLAKIFNRTEFRIYECGLQGEKHVQYDIVQHDAPIPQHCSLQEGLGAGPQLLPRVMSFEEGFIDYNAEGKITRDPIGVNANNARSGLGIKANGDLLIVMAAQVPEENKKGFSLQDLADELKALGAVKAMALDGGSSSSLLYEGHAYFGKFNKDGSPVIRPVKSVLMLTEP
jgi:hypothetical protein